MEKKPEIVVVAGPNGSGKSSYTQFIKGPGQFVNESFEYINADDIEASMDFSSLEAAKKATALREKALSEKRNFAFETVLSTRRNLDLLIKAKNEGYFIRCFYFITHDSSINVRRVACRVANGGHPVPIEKIISRYNKSLALIPELVSVCDIINIWDNSEDSALRIFRKKKEQIDYFETKYWKVQDIKKLTQL